MRQSWKLAAAASVAAWLGFAGDARTQETADYSAGGGSSLHYSAPPAAPAALRANRGYLDDDSGAVAAESANGEYAAPAHAAGCGGCGDACTCGGCDCEDCCQAEPWRLFGGGTILGFGLTGWIEPGATANTWNPATRYNGPVTFNDREEGYLNQLYAVAENPLDVADGNWDFAGRVDFIYGTDARFTKAIGLELDQNGGEGWNDGRSFYQFALPQFYGQIGNDRISLMAGHFYTIIGYEGVMAPGNFFYSHAYTHQYGEPFTHTGALANWTYSDTWRFVGGIHFGWEVFDSAVDRVGFLGGTYFTPTDDITIAFTMTSGDEIAFGGLLANRTMYSVVGAFDLTERLQWVVQHDQGWQDNALGFGQTAQWYGVNNYVFYTINDQWRAGARIEWFDDPQGTRVAGIGVNNPATGPFAGDFYECTFGVHWIPCPNITFRPEVRWDWFDGDNQSPRPFNDGQNNSQFLAAMDLIFLW